MGKKEFTAAAFDPESETFIVHITSFSSDTLPSFSLLELNVHPSRKSQISDLIIEEAPIKIPAKYSNFTDIFSLDLASELLKHTKINDHTIELVNGQQPPNRSIYSLRPVELETQKTYIKINLANRFIRLSKSPTGTPILFGRMLDGSLRLCIDYQGFNNLTIKNRYLLPLIGELLDRL